MSEGTIPTRRFQLDLIGAILVQIALALVFLLVPFGFDHAPEGGLDLNYLILFALAYFIAGIYGLNSSFSHRRWGLVVVQLLILLLIGTSMIY